MISLETVSSLYHGWASGVSAYFYFFLFFWRSVVSYKVTEMPIFNQDQIAKSEKINLYDSIDEEVLRSYNEFALASLIYYAMKEGACSEQSSRMTAMDAASKNAGKFWHVAARACVMDRASEISGMLWDKGVRGLINGMLPARVQGVFEWR